MLVAGILNRASWQVHFNHAEFVPAGHSLDCILCTFCTEGGCKGVDIGQRCRIVLCLQLPRHRKESCLAEEVMAVVNATLFGPIQPSFNTGPAYNTSCVTLSKAAWCFANIVKCLLEENAVQGPVM